MYAKPFFIADSKNQQRIVNVLHLVIHLEYGHIKKYEWITGCDGCKGTGNAPICSAASLKFWSFDTKAENNTKSDHCTVGEADCTGTNIGSCDLKVSLFFF